MRKQNCWEFKSCGRDKENERGICPAVLENTADGVNGGAQGGRVCWAVAGTYCSGAVQGTYAQKLLTCIMCDFRVRVKEEEGRNFRYIYFRKESA